MDDDFDSVSWQNDAQRTGARISASAHEVGDPAARPGMSGKRRSSTGPTQAGHNADVVDLGGIGDGKLECMVDTPLKESDGTKDAFISYLITTDVSLRWRL